MSDVFHRSVDDGDVSVPAEYAGWRCIVLAEDNLHRTMSATVGDDGTVSLDGFTADEVRVVLTAPNHDRGY